MSSWNRSTTRRRRNVTDQLDRAAEALGRATDVALACHINPDPDALGSMLGLAAFLKARGAKVVGSYGNVPFEAPRWIGALCGAAVLVPPGEFPKKPELMLTLGCSP